TSDFSNDYYYYGTDQPAIEALAVKDPSLKEKLHERLPYTKAAIVWAVHNEMCMTVDDALARRTRAILLDSKAAVEASPLVARLMAGLLQKDETWITEQITAFKKIAVNYIPIANH
ncbi:MAG TPA: glycerol-3-phosphate dehydrogenase C-terminal domain-containing protein, partial [Chitinophagaceae bacterium]|nr:glycerol-3-phosphate dehydrogenase C-terminal domain-containing protein [Chitinophagaceae bacterium]